MFKDSKWAKKKITCINPPNMFSFQEITQESINTIELISSAFSALGTEWGQNHLYFAFMFEKNMRVRQK